MSGERGGCLGREKGVWVKGVSGEGGRCLGEKGGFLGRDVRVSGGEGWDSGAREGAWGRGGCLAEGGKCLGQGRVFGGEGRVSGGKGRMSAGQGWVSGGRGGPRFGEWKVEQAKAATLFVVSPSPMATSFSAELGSAAEALRRPAIYNSGDLGKRWGFRSLPLPRPQFPRLDGGGTAPHSGLLSLALFLLPAGILRCSDPFSD